MTGPPDSGSRLLHLTCLTLGLARQEALSSAGSTATTTSSVTSANTSVHAPGAAPRSMHACTQHYVTFRSIHVLEYMHVGCNRKYHVCTKLHSGHIKTLNTPESLKTAHWRISASVYNRLQSCSSNNTAPHKTFNWFLADPTNAALLYKVQCCYGR